MNLFVYFAVIYHLFPLVFFFQIERIPRLNKIVLFSFFLITSSFLADVIGLSLAESGINTTLCSIVYQIAEQFLSILLISSVACISKKKEKVIVSFVSLLSISQILYCNFNEFLFQSDYLNLVSGVFICLYAMLVLFKLIYKTTNDSLKIDLNIWPVVAIFFYTSTMLIPQMIINIDDTVEFPIIFHEVRIGVIFGSNIIRDSLFAFFFLQAKKNEL
jgi:hypothetical protein